MVWVRYPHGASPPTSGKLKNQMKEGFHIKPITKTEAMYLRDNGYEDYVQRAAICKSYYIVETIESLKFLEDYRKSVTVYSYFKKTK